MKHKEKLIIFGNGSVAMDLYWGVRETYDVVAFTVDPQVIREDAIDGLPVVPFDDRLAEQFDPADHHMHIAIGYVNVNRLRAEKFRKARAMGYRLTNHISHDAIMSPQHPHIGENCQIGPQVIIHPGAIIGDNVFIGYRCIIPHDVVIEDHCFLAPNVTIGGGARIGAYSYIGMSATIRNWVKIGESNIIGVGAVILEDTGDREVFVAPAAEKLPISSDQLPLK